MNHTEDTSKQNVLSKLMQLCDACDTHEKQDESGVDSTSKTIRHETWQNT